MENSFVNSENYEIEVAISTDTILYSPFYLSYYGGDFNNTPFGSLNVNIVGTTNDMTFKHDVKLRGDGFATFSSITGLSTVSICDPSFLVYLKSLATSGDQTQIEEEFNKFLELIKDHSDIQDSQSFYDVPSKYFKIEEFKKTLDKIKIVGGLISKMAFSVVGSEDLSSDAKKYDKNFDKKKFGYDHSISAKGEDFVKQYVDNKFIFYPPPSTGNCIGYIHSNKNYKKVNKTLTRDFGTELTPLYKNQELKSLSISCDFVSIDFLRSEEFKKDGDILSTIFEIEDLGTDYKNFLFTGIIANSIPKNSERLKAFLYGIDKNLFYISKYASRKPQNALNLINFYQTKLNYSLKNEEELFSLLIADPIIRNKIVFLINDKNRKFNFNSIIRYYAQRLINWSKIEFEGLYYASTYPMKDGICQLVNDLKSITEIRSQHDTILNIDTIEFSDFINEDLLAGWRNREIEFLKFEKELDDLNTKPKLKDILLVFILPFLLWFKWPRKQYFKIWFYLSHPSFIFIVGGVFILLEIVSSLCHIFDMHFYDSKLQIVIPIFTILFWYLLFLIVFSILPIRRLYKLHKSRKYIYRNANL